MVDVPPSTTFTNLHEPPPTALQNRRLFLSATLVTMLSTAIAAAAWPPLRIAFAVRPRTVRSIRATCDGTAVTLPAVLKYDSDNPFASTGPISGCAV